MISATNVLCKSSEDLRYYCNNQTCTSSMKYRGGGTLLQWRRKKWTHPAELPHEHTRLLREQSCSIIEPSIPSASPSGKKFSRLLVHLRPRLFRYSGPPLIRTPFLPNNSVLIREVSFGEREHYIHS